MLVFEFDVPGFGGFHNITNGSQGIGGKSFRNPDGTKGCHYTVHMQNTCAVNVPRRSGGKLWQLLSIA